jgi:hypothetical protein
MARLYAPLAGVRVPGTLGVADGNLWLDRVRWVPGAIPRPDVVDRFVEAAITTPLIDGTVVAFGTPHVEADGYLVVEDCGIVARLEPDEIALLAAALRSFANIDPEGAALAIHGLTGAPVPPLLDTARRACSALLVDWTPCGIGLSLHLMACRADMAGARLGALSLLAGELLRRLDLRHAHPRGTLALSEPSDIHRLTLSAEQSN